MKKTNITFLFIILLCSMIGEKAFANDNTMVQFVDKNGKVVADGTTVNVAESEKDAFGEVMFKTGLYVKVATEENVHVGIDYDIKSLPNGAFQICFPQNCVMKEAAGQYSTEKGSFGATDKKDIQAEWIPDEDDFGTCTVELQVNIYTYNALTKAYTLAKNGPKVTVNMIYKDPAQENKIVQFVNKNGNVISDGATINIFESEKDAFGDLIFKTGLYIKVSTKEKVYVGIDYEIKSLPNGAFQICFPQNCVMREATGQYSTEKGSFGATDKKDIQAEWIPDEGSFGTCTVVFQANVYIYNTVTKKYVLDKEGPKVTVNMNYTPKCAKPTIYYSNGKLSFKSDTEGAKFVSEITDSDIKKHYDNKVQLCVTYNISVYATKSGYENSDVATATLYWIDVEPKTEGITDGTTGAKQIEANAVLIQTENGQISVSGANDGTAISVFATNGLQIGSAVSNSGQAVINANLPSGSIAIVKIGVKSVKVAVK